MDAFYKKLIKKVLEIFVLGLLIPEAEKFVKETSNPYDDQAVEFLKQLLISIIKKVG